LDFAGQIFDLKHQIQNLHFKILDGAGVLGRQSGFNCYEAKDQPNENPLNNHGGHALHFDTGTSSIGEK
jgi:hypothetical protein